MTRLLPVAALLCATLACVPGGRVDAPESGWFTASVTSSDEGDSALGGQGNRASISGTVSALTPEAQAHRVIGYEADGLGITVVDDTGRTWAIGLTATLAEVDVVSSLDLAIGDAVTVTGIEEMPFWSEEGLLITDDAGLVFAGVNGRLIDLPLDDHLTVSDGPVAEGRFEHSCGEGQFMHLDVVGDTEVSVLTNESAEVEVDGAAMTFSNLSAWSHVDVNGMACLDWNVPYSWIVAR